MPLVKVEESDEDEPCLKSLSALQTNYCFLRVSSPDAARPTHRPTLVVRPVAGRLGAKVVHEHLIRLSVIHGEGADVVASMTQ
jgi:hypothetical protein